MGPSRTQVPIRGLPEDEIRSITGFQAAMAKSMTAALKVPHFSYADEVSVTQKFHQYTFTLGLYDFLLCFINHILDQTNNCYVLVSEDMMNLPCTSIRSLFL